MLHRTAANATVADEVYRPFFVHGKEDSHGLKEPIQIFHTHSVSGLGFIPHYISILSGSWISTE